MKEIMKTFTTHLATALLSAGIALTGAAVLRGEFSAPTTAGTVILEDDHRWDCRTMGNLICGAGNAQGVPAGDYSR